MKTLLAADQLFLNRGDKQVLKAITLSVSPGETVVLRGASGCGKSTLLWALARMLPLKSGRLDLEDKPSQEWPVTLWRTQVALVLQKHSMMPGSVRDNLLLPWSLKIRGNDPPGDGAFREALEAVGLEGIELTERANRLSVGQTARLSLVRSLLTDSKCLLLDEPLAALDPGSTRLVQERIREFTVQGGAVIAASHDVETFSSARTFHMKGGTLWA